MNQFGTAVAAILLGAFVQAAQFPLIAGSLIAGPNSRVQLTNRGDQPVTAWALAVTTPAVDGQSRRFEETVDAYLSEITRDLPGATDKLNRLLPGEGREVPLQSVPAGSSVEIVAVVLQDGTAMGDARTIELIFERRRMERDDLRSVVDVFGAVLPATTGMAALQELQRRFASGFQRPDSTPVRAAREAVDAYLKVATPENADALVQQLRAYADLVERQYELAVRHSQQKRP